MKYVDLNYNGDLSMSEIIAAARGEHPSTEENDSTEKDGE